MTLPTIKDYDMPTGFTLQENKVNWQVDSNRAVFLIHDMQEYFIDAYEDDSKLIKVLVNNIKKIKKKCKEHGIPVIYSAQPEGQSSSQRALLKDFWGTGIPEGLNKEKIIKELEPEDDDIILTKWRYSAFKKNNLLGLLEEQGRDQIIISGVYAHIGCLLTAADAFMEGIQPFFLSDSIADFSLEYHNQAIEYASQKCATSLTTADLIKSLQSESLSMQVSSNKEISINEVRNHVENLLGNSGNYLIKDNDNLLELGLDSIRIMNLIGTLNEEGINVSFAELALHPTLIDWWKIINQRVNI